MNLIELVAGILLPIFATAGLRRAIASLAIRSPAWLFHLTFGPGVILHETAHALTVLLMPSMRLTGFQPYIFAAYRRGGGLLGKVTLTQPTNLSGKIQAALVGIAPLLAGMSIVRLGLLFFGQTNNETNTLLFLYSLFPKGHPSLVAILSCYVYGSIALNWSPSLLDIKSSWAGMVIIMSFLAFIFFLFQFNYDKLLIEITLILCLGALFATALAVMFLVAFLFVKIHSLISR